MPYQLYISPCPNDTFIFEALVAGKMADFPKESIAVHLHDIAVLNERALTQTPDIIKVSYGAMGQLFKKYQLLSVGSALGRGVGPLLVGKSLSFPARLRLLIPGRFTTANVLFDKYAAHHLPHTPVEKQCVLFSDIIPMLQQNKADMGLLIHEGRFTYADQGMQQVADLGAFWEDTYGLPLPLGGIMVRRSLPKEEKLRIKEGIKASLLYAKHQLPTLGNFIRENAQEMEESVLRAHIDLYVNDDTIDLNPIAQKAIQTLLQPALSEPLPPDWLI